MTQADRSAIYAHHHSPQPASLSTAGPSQRAIAHLATVANCVNQSVSQLSLRVLTEAIINDIITCRSLRDALKLADQEIAQYASELIGQS